MSISVGIGTGKSGGDRVVIRIENYEILLDTDGARLIANQINDWADHIESISDKTNEVVDDQ